MERAALEAYLADFLQVPDFRDYCPNGLQVEGRAEVARIVTGVACIAAGYHATERYGVQSLGEHLAQRFGLQHRFIEVENPV